MTLAANICSFGTFWSTPNSYINDVAVVTWCLLPSASFWWQHAVNNACAGHLHQEFRRITKFHTSIFSHFFVIGSFYLFLLRQLASASFPYSSYILPGPVRVPAGHLLLSARHLLQRLIPFVFSGLARVIPFPKGLCDAFPSSKLPRTSIGNGQTSIRLSLPTWLWT